jgi:hypothetical protein
MDARVDAAPELRSLRIGEIFDRATTFYVKNFVAFTLIMLTFEVPVSLVSYFFLGSVAYSTLIDEVAHPMQRHAQEQLAGSLLGGIILFSLVVAIVAPIMYNAVACGVGDMYDGNRPSYVRSFQRVLQRIGPFIGTLLICAAIVLGVYVAILIVFLVVGLAGAGLTMHARGAPNLIGVFIALGIAVLATLFVLVLMLLACTFSLYASTIERRSPGSAIGAGFARVFTRREIGKAALITISSVALQLVAALVLAGVSALILQIPAAGRVLDLAFSAIAGSIFRAYLSVLIAVYYFDVRTRAEGLDLEVDLHRLSPTA